MKEQGLSFKTAEGIFSYRVRGGIINKGKVLLLKEDRFDFWNLSGGRASLFETSEVAIKREVFEELGDTPIIERILWITENLYYFDSLKVKNHDLSFYYLLSFPKESFIYYSESGSGKDEHLDGKTVLFNFRWFDINVLDEVNLKPRFLKKALSNIPKSSKHFVIDDLSDG